MRLPLTEKYRPKTLEEICGNTEVINCLKNIRDSNVFPHMLFYGPPGTGKTTAIKALVKNLPSTSVLELNASDDRGISTVRHTIKEFASTFARTIKIVILDEVDFMSRDAQNALRRIIEDFSTTTRFCLIANYPKKIIPAVLSRCVKFRFSPITDADERIKDICSKEGIEIDEEGVDYLKKLSYGDMRKIVNDIQGINGSFDKIDKNTVLTFSGMVDEDTYKEIFNDLCELSFDELKYKLNIIRQDRSIDLGNILLYIGELVKNSKLSNKMKILKEMNDLEYRLSLGCNENLQMNALIGAFVLNRK
ncbi:Replication factor C subunit 5 [Nosema granulosis]|uniref:Replication factor C subunit 5 n=1 Tax=Nosema granulosis TaxID=83296 RepID=A0A9P6GZD7_9MICR|nr:Replication factor C subunit 5 [Nosema granulosis]